MRRQQLILTGLLTALMALAYGQNVGIGTATPLTRLHVADGDIFLGDAGGTNGFIIHSRFAFGYDFLQITSRTGGIWEWGKGITFVRSTGNVGIGTTGPQARLHVFGKAIVDDGTTGTPIASTWGSNGSRIILWPGSATATPYQIGIAPSEMWHGTPTGTYWSVFRGTERQFIISPNNASCPSCVNLANAGGTTFPSVFIGNVVRGFDPGPYPKYGNFLHFGGPTNSFVDNTDPAFMYVYYINSDQTRLRIHVEDNGNGGGPAILDGVSILGASCDGGVCFNINNSSLLFEFLANGQAYKPGGGAWAAISDARLKEDIQPYTRGLAELRALRPVRYKYKKEYWAADDRHFTGLIAQEVQSVVPEMVHPYLFRAIGEKHIEVLAVDPSDLTYMLINAVKDLDAENQQLKARVAALENEKKTLEERLSLIESRVSALEGNKSTR